MPSSNHRWIYDVFLHFRGEYTSGTFVSYLHSALSNAGVRTFVDRTALTPPEVSRAIEGSHIALIVFSENYSESALCLDKLEKIVDCHNCYRQVIVPIFYDVDPCEVRNQTGAFGKALEELAEKRFAGRRVVDLLLRWGKLLFQVTHLTGWDITDCRDEAELVKKIVNDVMEKLDNTLLSVTKFPVGLESQVNEVVPFIKNRSNKVCVIGIWGMGGVGKTTVAKAIYNRIRCDFDNGSFIENIRQVYEKDRGYIHLLQQLLSDVQKPKLKIHSIGMGIAMIKNIPYQKRALIVLDDVNKFEQLIVLWGNHEWIGSGSVLIVTTRDAHLLNLLKVDRVFVMKDMKENESLELFSWHAFRKASPRKDFSELSRNIVAYCGGLPLTLEVLGSYLYESTKEEWESLLSKLKKIPNDQLEEKLRISYDGLDDEEKKVFLDICCFFVGKDRAYVSEILNGCGFYPEIAITVLEERNLIKIEKNNKLGMHDLLRNMGREIIHQSSPKDPGNRSQLWVYEDIVEVLTENSGTNAVEGLALKLEKTGTICFNTKAFEKMNKLRLLKLNCAQLVGDYKYLPKQLRWINWRGFPSTHMPDNFDQPNAVAIDLKCSNIKVLWKKPQLLTSLKSLNLSHSRYLRHTPDLSKLPNLKQLVLKDCPNLIKVHSSIGCLRNLLQLNLRNCKSLTELPVSLYKLKSLRSLTLSGCLKIDKLEEDIVQMESLTILSANDTGIKELPRSLVKLNCIAHISLCGYEGLAHDVFPSIIWSWMSPTMNPLSYIYPSWSMSSSLVFMDMQIDNLGDLASILSSLPKFRSVWVQCCSEFQLTQELRRIVDYQYDAHFTKMETSYASQVSKFSLRFLLVSMGCSHTVIDALGQSISQGLTIGASDMFLPGDNYPYWLTRTGEGHSVCFEVPRVSYGRIKGMALCVVYSSTLKNVTAQFLVSVLIVNYTKCIFQIYKHDTAIDFNEEDWQGLISKLEPDDIVELYVVFGHGFTVKNTTVYLVL